MPRVYVVSAPSGTGKTTLNSKLVAANPNVEISVSHTTRAPRPGEVSGKSYHYVTPEEFKRLISLGQMLEWANVFGNLYGTSRGEVQRILALDHHVLLEIDVQGARSVLTQMPEAITIFILPPSIEALWKRLEMRGTDSLEDRWNRLMTAKQEIEVGYMYEHFIINDNKNDALEELTSVIIKGKHSKISHSDGVIKCQKLLEEFETSALLKELRLKLETK